MKMSGKDENMIDPQTASGKIKCGDWRAEGLKKKKNNRKSKNA